MFTRAPSSSPPGRKTTRKESLSPFPQSICPVPRSSWSPSAKFRNSKFDTESDLDAFTECFDKGLKNSFSEGSKPQFVKFGSARDNDGRCDVKNGKLTLQG